MNATLLIRDREDNSDSLTLSLSKNTSGTGKWKVVRENGLFLAYESKVYSHGSWEYSPGERSVRLTVPELLGIVMLKELDSDFWVALERGRALIGQGFIFMNQQRWILWSMES
jgi:hypothetical protein